MASLARSTLESLLRARRLDRTLTGSMPARPVLDLETVVPTGFGLLDERMGGGVPRGQLSEIVGSRSSGRTSVLAGLLASATRSGELVALVDTFDAFDPASGAEAGVVLPRLLWVRGDGGPDPDRAVQLALKALNLVLQGAEFAVAALDLSDAPVRALQRLPFTTWMRLQRVIRPRTACVLLGSAPIARSPGGLTLALQRADAGLRWAGETDHARVLRGIRARVRVVRPHLDWSGVGEVSLDLGSALPVPPLESVGERMLHPSRSR